MARLNELPQPATESVDALKRRFVRQNREIAKANSVQSLRIRNLETEVSRLLGENVSLREQIIKLHYELENNAGKMDTSTIDDFKTRLEGKLREVGNLVQELGDVQKAAKKRSQQQKRKSLDSKASPKRSPNQRLWKNTQTLSDLMGEAEGRLPPILEDKQFPRRTLDLDELHGVLADPANLTDSPDLGPPPVAHFEEGNAITFEGRSGRRASRHNLEATEPSQNPLSANLETRRRRRESIHSKDAPFEVDSSSNKQPIVIQATENKSQSIKAGAKRKWNGRDENEQDSKEAEKPREETTKTVADKTNRSTAQKVPERPSSRADRVKEVTKETSANINPSSRRALGPKSVNIDPQSPVKLRNVDAKEKPIPTKETLTQRIRDRNIEKEKYRAKPPAEEAKPIIEPTTKPKKVTLPLNEPETPAPLDLFSPTSTEPSARQESRGDTPPPPDLGPDTTTGSFGRASRRSRASTVSYAEPNLRDKMRRPTKDLVDAVGAEERARQAAHAVKNDSSSSSIASALASIKLEDNPTIPNWKGIPPEAETHAQRTRQTSSCTSPLSQKASSSQQQQSSDLPPTVTADRHRRRTSTLPRTTPTSTSTDPSSPTAAPAPALPAAASTASSTIAALARPTTSTAKRRPEAPPRTSTSPPKATFPASQIEPHNNHQLNSKRSSSSSSIFDFTGSSPDLVKTTAVVDDLATSSALRVSGEAAAGVAARTARSARRHSSVPALLEQGGAAGVGVGIKVSRRGGAGRRESMA